MLRIVVVAMAVAVTYSMNIVADGVGRLDRRCYRSQCCKIERTCVCTYMQPCIVVNHDNIA